MPCEGLRPDNRQRPDFGPVILVYSDGPILQQSDEAYSVTLQRCDRHPNNEAAIEEACRLGLDPLLGNPLILAEDGSVIWDSPELLDECNRRSCATLG
jgi:hypothetical protein